MNKTFKKFISSILIAAISLPSFAGPLDGALKMFDSNAVSSMPQVYKGSAGNFASFGSFQLASPRDGDITVSLFNIAVPNVRKVGCSGIDAFLGGFEFIGGEQIKKLFNTITANAPGFVIHAVLKWLCPQCESIVQAMENLTALANSFNLNACKISGALANKAGSMFMEATGLPAKAPWGDLGMETLNKLKDKELVTNFAKSLCKETKGGGNDNFMESINDACASAARSIATWLEGEAEDINRANLTGGDRDLAEEKLLADFCSRTALCNSLFVSLRAVQQKGRVSRLLSSYDNETADRMRSERILFLNLFGTVLPLPGTVEGRPVYFNYNDLGSNSLSADAIAESVPSEIDQKPVKPTIDADDLYMMMMCGTNPTAFLSASTQTGVFSKGEGLNFGGPVRVGKSLQVYCRNFYNKKAADFIDSGLEGSNLDGYCKSSECPKDGKGTSTSTLRDQIRSTESLPSETLKKLAGHAQKYLKTQQMWTCIFPPGYAAAAGESPFDSCPDVRSVPLEGLRELQVEEGYILQIYRLLLSSVLAIQAGKEIPGPALSLMASVPFPLYQLVNMSAVYPAESLDTLDSIAGYIADIVVQAKLMQIINFYQTRDFKTFLTEDFMAGYFGALSALRIANTERTTRFAASMTMQETLIKQISMLQESLQREVMTQDLLGNSQYAGSNLQIGNYSSKPPVAPAK